MKEDRKRKREADWVKGKEVDGQKRRETERGEERGKKK